MIISINSWNVNGSKYFNEKINLRGWINPCTDLATPDIYIFGMQEIVDLNATNIMFNNNSENIKLWINLLTFNLGSIDKYFIYLI